VKNEYRRILSFSALLLLGCLLSACGGSSGSATPTTTISGVVGAGPASGTTVVVKTAAGTEVARTTLATDSNGAFSIAIPTSALSSDLIFEASGGTFSDEATSTPGVTFGTLTAHIAGGALGTGSNVTIDPSSTIIQKLVAGGKNRIAAFTSFSTAFGYKPDSRTKIAFANLSSAATTSERLAGVKVAAFSQLTKDLTLTPEQQFELINKLAEDLSDDKLDGKKGADPLKTASGTAIPEDICNRFSGALVTFVNDSGKNKSRLTIDKIDSPAFNKIALTASYKVEYVPGMMAAAQGKTTFKIKLTNLDGTAASGKTITLTPKMNMPGMSHSAPVANVAESATPGTYDATVYYLMASGPGMGVWELKVKIGTETATFYPAVAMNMGTTARTTLKGISDTIPAMSMKILPMAMSGSPRTYYLFNDGISGTTAKLFIAATDDSAMKLFPAVSAGTTLHDAMNAAWTVDGPTSSVLVSADSGVTWITATDNGGGHWSAEGLPALASGSSVRVKVKINGEQKTTAGSATLSSSNLDYATFTISSGM
jgi:hypothetical protein